MNDFVGFMLFLLLFPPIAVLLEQMSRVVHLVRKKRYDMERYGRGMVELEDLNFLTAHEFAEWCGEFLEKSGYEEVQISPTGTDGGKDIVCKKYGNTIYVECKRHLTDLSAGFRVDTDIVRKLIGAMLHDHVHHGIIITTGSVTEAARQYIQSLGSQFLIEVIDGEMLIERCIQYGIYLTA